MQGNGLGPADKAGEKSGASSAVFAAATKAPEATTREAGALLTTKSETASRRRKRPREEDHVDQSPGASLPSETKDKQILSPSKLRCPLCPARSQKRFAPGRSFRAHLRARHKDDAATAQVQDWELFETSFRPRAEAFTVSCEEEESLRKSKLRKKTASKDPDVVKTSPQTPGWVALAQTDALGKLKSLESDEMWSIEFRDRLGATAEHYAAGAGAMSVLRYSRLKTEWTTARQGVYGNDQRAPPDLCGQVRGGLATAALKSFPKIYPKMQSFSAVLVVAMACLIGSSNAQSWDCSKFEGDGNNKETSCLVYKTCLDAIGFDSWNTTVKDTYCGAMTYDGNVCNSGKRCTEVDGVKIRATCDSNDRIKKILVEGAALNEYIVLNETKFEECLAMASEAPKFELLSLPDTTSDVTPFSAVCQSACSDVGCVFGIDVLDAVNGTYDVSISEFTDDGSAFDTGFDLCANATLLTGAPTSSPTSTPTTMSPTSSPTTASPTTLATAAPTSTDAGRNDTDTDSPTVAPTGSPTDAPSSGSALSTSIVLVATAVVATLGL
ncbi:Hypothetical Protein FCC1311_052962 [Hondaea fermentalgiana]|uniref:Uncharacterized protein n=1 Tax=Hondaea fermentalgiana TaxID=2315210 RepID=A0A2R5GMI2_9STRA|nr:Hypothetical Protein FCC1311_052962 [Hondaea fermentalgiana]|eukprot:GBG29074.1 Hypothetical Protein FCC1311_052962 [Hondaea fermentalgiana]